VVRSWDFGESNKPVHPGVSRAVVRNL
jgi:hypothetical protein